MPIYLWRCEAGHEEEVLRSMADATKPLLCAVCFLPSKRVFTPPGLVLGQQQAAENKFDKGMRQKMNAGTPNLPDYSEHTPEMPKRSGLGDMQEYLEDKHGPSKQ